MMNSLYRSNLTESRAPEPHPQARLDGRPREAAREPDHPSTSIRARGAEFTLADLYTFYTFGLAGTLANKVLGMDLLADRPDLTGLLGRLAERPSIARVSAEVAG